MRNSQPPFETTEEMINLIAEISELVGRVSAAGVLQTSPKLRRANRIRSIYGSLAIEQNSLTMDQITALLNGKRVIAPPRDIAEVKNAYEIYDHLRELDPFSAEDLQSAHGVMMRGLVEDAGTFRSRPVGVVDQAGNILHFGTLPRYVPDQIQSLLEWAESSRLHMLLRSCAFHYEFELIHPFSDGNGRVGRLWHTLLLYTWNPLFAWIPIESIVHDRQEEYYAAINRSNAAGESTEFIEFMLASIKASLMEMDVLSDGVSDAAERGRNARREQINAYLETHAFITNGDVRALCGVSSATANRLLSSLTAGGFLRRIRANGHWAYERGEQDTVGS